MEKNGFVIEADEAKSLMKEAGVSTVSDLLLSLVPAARRLARPPISNYHVGAVGLGISGRIYLGVNLEFPGLPLHHSVHAEQFLITNAALHNEPSIQCIAVSAVPCGHCRQFFQELRNASKIQILVTSDISPSFRPLSDFLPRPFGPPDLLNNDVPLLLEKHENNIGLEEIMCNGVYNTGLEERLREKATEAARGAHAPYSGCVSGFAVADGEGRVYAGSYLESAAYNPSFGPVQAAMVAYVAAGGGKWEAIVAGALVEGEGAVVSHEVTARIFFEKVAPGAKLWVHRFRLG